MLRCNGPISLHLLLKKFKAFNLAFNYWYDLYVMHWDIVIIYFKRPSKRDPIITSALLIESIFSRRVTPWNATLIWLPIDCWQRSIYAFSNNILVFRIKNSIRKDFYSCLNMLRCFPNNGSSNDSPVLVMVMLNKNIQKIIIPLYSFINTSYVKYFIFINNIPFGHVFVLNNDSCLKISDDKIKICSWVDCSCIQVHLIYINFIRFCFV